MKKIYVFFTWSISDIGGTQLYLKHKMDYLRKDGWYVYIVSGDEYPHPLIEGISDNLICERAIVLPEYYFFNIQRNKVINRILEFLPKEFSECIFESHSLPIATWAESIAQLCSAKHIIFNNEETPICPLLLKQFVLFKLNRKEVAGISRDCAEYLLKPISESIAYDPALIAWGANDCIQDVEYDLPSQIAGRYTICLFGRLNKPYMKNTASEICKFVENKTEEFNIIYIGGEYNKRKPIQHRLEKEYRHLHNINLIFTGYLYPVPRTLIKQIDVCISGSGASIAMTAEGVSTICVDPRDCQAIGVLGINTLTTLYSAQNATEKHSISYMLEVVKSNPLQYKPPKFEVETRFQDHLDFLKNTIGTKDYYVSFLEYNTIRLITFRLLFSLFSPIFVLKFRNVLESLGIRKD